MFVTYLNRGYVYFTNRSKLQVPYYLFAFYTFQWITIAVSDSCFWELFEDLNSNFNFYLDVQKADIYQLTINLFLIAHNFKEITDNNISRVSCLQSVEQIIMDWVECTLIHRHPNWISRATRTVKRRYHSSHSNLWVIKFRWLKKNGRAR